jgi:hypothetical protein
MCRDRPPRENVLALTRYCEKHNSCDLRHQMRRLPENIRQMEGSTGVCPVLCGKDDDRWKWSALLIAAAAPKTGPGSPKIRATAAVTNSCADLPSSVVAPKSVRAQRGRAHACLAWPWEPRRHRAERGQRRESVSAGIRRLWAVKTDHSQGPRARCGPNGPPGVTMLKQRIVTKDFCEHGAPKWPFRRVPLYTPTGLLPLLPQASGTLECLSQRAQDAGPLAIDGSPDVGGKSNLPQKSDRRCE